MVKPALAFKVRPTYILASSLVVVFVNWTQSVVLVAIIDRQLHTAIVTANCHLINDRSRTLTDMWPTQRPRITLENFFKTSQRHS